MISKGCFQAQIISQSSGLSTLCKDIICERFLYEYFPFGKMLSLASDKICMYSVLVEGSRQSSHELKYIIF